MRYSNSEKGENSRLYGIIEANNKDRYGSGTDEIVDLKRKITLAKGKTKVDLVIKNARIINVFSGDVYQTDVAIADGIFVGIGEGYDNARRSYEANGRYLCPGLIDGHIHIESTFLSPIEFCNAVALHGTSSVLPVIPSLKLTDKGLVDVDKFQFTDLWVNHRYSDKN